MASTGLEIAASAINAATTEIAVTSENIANAQTPGYAAQRAQLAAQPGGDMYGVGSGVAVTSVAQITNALLSSNNLQAQGALQSLTASQQVLTGIQDVFPLGQSAAATSSSASGTSNTSIAGQLANFWSSWDGISQNPSSLAARTQVVNQAQGLVTSLNEASTQLSQLATNSLNQITSQVGQVNQLLQQAANLNAQISTTVGGGGGANQLVDQLNQVVGQLGQLAGVSVRPAANGEATINIGGVTLVQGYQATLLQVTPPSGSSMAAMSITTGNIFNAGTGVGTGSVVGTNSGDTPVVMASGSIGGLMSGVGPSGTIHSFQQQLDTVASNLANLVNTQLGVGFTAAGASGQPLFHSTGGAITASTISLNSAVVADPTLLAASGTATESANNGSNAQAMAELATSPTLTAATSPDLAYQQLITNIGSATQAVDSQVSSQNSVATQAQQALQSATGVNQNTELTNLMQFQSAYQASAKIVTVIDATIQSLLQAV